MKLSEVAHLCFNPAMLRGKKVDLVIDNLTMEYVDWAEEPVPMLRFRGELLGLPLRDWNASSLAAAFGDDSRAFVGKAVTLSVDTVNDYEFVALSPAKLQPKAPATKTVRSAPRKRRPAARRSR